MGMPAKMLPTATPSSSAGSSEPTKKHASQSFPRRIAGTELEGHGTHDKAEQHQHDGQVEPENVVA